MASLLPSHGSDACSPTASGYECASGTTDDSTGPGPSTATEDSARRSARPRPDSGISGTPSPAAAPAATVVHDGVARLFDDNLGYRWWDHRQQTTAQERAYANKLLHNYPSIKSDAPHERRAAKSDVIANFPLGVAVSCGSESHRPLTLPAKDTVLLLLPRKS